MATEVVAIVIYITVLCMITICEIILYTQEDLSRNDIVAGMHNSGQNHWVLIACLNSLVIYCLFKIFLYIHSLFILYKRNFTA